MKKSLKIPKEKPESVNRRRTVTKRKRTDNYINHTHKTKDREPH